MANYSYNKYSRYSRLKRIEEGKNKRTTLIYIVLSILFVLFLLFLGPRVLGVVSGLVANVNTENQDTVEGDTIAPAPPRFNSLPKFINQTSFEVSGYSEPESVVSIFVSGNKSEAVTDKEGKFSTNIDIQKGDNEIYAKAKDLSGNESEKTVNYTITYDDEKPEVEITKPKDGESFYGNSQRQLTLEGKTEGGAKVTINDRVVIVDSNGGFRFPTNLGDGENSFNIKSSDQAGNQTELTIKVTFNP